MDTKPAERPPCGEDAPDTIKPATPRPLPELPQPDACDRIARQFLRVPPTPDQQVILEGIWKLYNDTAQVLLELPHNAELTVAIRHLLESKDCAIRSVLWP